MYCFEKGLAPSECPYAPSVTDQDIQLEGHTLLAAGLRLELQHASLSPHMRRRLTERLATINCAIDELVELTSNQPVSLDPDPDGKPACPGQPFVEQRGGIRITHCARDLAQQAEIEIQ